MDFHEPDLEDLIQRDLHTEMNKILDQSESESCIAVSKINVPDHDNAVTSESDIILQPKGKNIPSIATSLEKAKKLDPANTDQSNKENPSLLVQVHSSKADDFQVKSEPNESTFTGHFSLEKVPAQVEALKKEPGQVAAIEPGELSNLAWLTGLDVQQTLQQSEFVESNSHLSESSVVTNPSSLPVTGACALEPTAVPPECISVSAHNQSMRQTMKKQSMRYTPIQPNINFEDCQRYQLHPGDPIHRKLYPSEHVPEHRYGMHRGFHPYPPPPYGSSGAIYMSDNYHHGRLHSQGKKVFPKPVYSYSCLIAMSLRASKTGCLPVSDIYHFMMENFPYFKTAPDGWKNSVRHNLSLNKCFEKVEKPNGSQRKGCLWALNPAKITKMEEEVQKWKRKDPEAIRRSMSNPEELDRELEEIRRADEEATRRRMLSMNTHGLSILTPPPPGYNPYVRPSNPHQQHPNLHPSGTASLPTTPQHYHQQRTPQRQPMMQASGQVALSNPVDDQGRPGHPPRQLFNYTPSDQQGFSYGVPGVSSTPNSGFDPEVSGHQDFQMLTSYSSNSSSGTSGLLSTLTDTFSKSAHEFHDVDLGTSLADLSALQGSLWDENDPALLPHSLVNDIDPFDEGITQQSAHLHPNIASSSSISAMEQCPTSEEPASEPSVYGTPSHFRGDMPFLNGSNSKAVVH